MVDILHVLPRRMFHPNISPRSPKQEGVRFAGAPVLSSSKGEYWKVHKSTDDDDVLYMRDSLPFAFGCLIVE